MNSFRLKLVLVSIISLCLSCAFKTFQVERHIDKINVELHQLRYVSFEVARNLSALRAIAAAQGYYIDDRGSPYVLEKEETNE